MDVISDFIEQYEKEYDYYGELAQKGLILLENGVQNNGIKAILSCRAKKVERLKEKLIKRNEKKKYKSKSEIIDDIVDLAGIRVALYFPSERIDVDLLIEDIFDVVEKKEFPENPDKPILAKRFSGYWATHYRVKIKENKIQDKRYCKSIIEIQVASVLMHAWSEVEHDLVYKPFSGKLSHEELAILDEINGLVLVGEIALERLQIAISERTKAQTLITNNYDVNYLLKSSFDKLSEVKKIDFGNLQPFQNYLKTFENIDTKQLSEALANINTNIKDTFSDQVFQNFISNAKNINNINPLFQKLASDFMEAKYFEEFTSKWITFEKLLKVISIENNLNDSKSNNLNYNKIYNFLGFSDKKINEINSIRQIRNQIFHGKEGLEKTQIIDSINSLKKLIEEIQKQKK